jgi:hypothetical protein
VQWFDQMNGESIAHNPVNQAPSGKGELGLPGFSCGAGISSWDWCLKLKIKMD